MCKTIDALYLFALCFCIPGCSVDKDTDVYIQVRPPRTFNRVVDGKPVIDSSGQYTTHDLDRLARGYASEHQLAFDFHDTHPVFLIWQNEIEVQYSHGKYRPELIAIVGWDGYV